MTSTYRKRAIPEATRRAVAMRYGCTPGQTKTDVPCHWCGKLGDIYWHRLASGKPSAWVSFSHELDHLVPERLGGGHEPENVVLACRPCNRKRGHRVSDSLQPHDILTEEGVSDSRPTHSRKGREGKGREQGSLITHPFHLTVGASGVGGWMAADAAEIGGESCR